MPTFGAFQTVREIASGALVSVHETLREGKPGDRCAVKVWSPPALIGESPEPPDAARANLRARAFFDAGAAQKRLAEHAGPGGNWAAVLEQGPLPEGGSFVAMELGSLGSLRRLAVARVALDAPLLSRVVGGIVEGLRQAETAGRGHGNLKASNVLLAGDADLTTARVLLVDPLPDSQADSARDRLADLRALGELIVLLITHEPSKGGWPIDLSPAWSRLGRVGAKWLDLVNRLLDPNDEASRPTLDELAGIVAALAVRDRGRRPLVLGAIGAAVLIGVLATVVWVRAGNKGITDLKSTLWATDPAKYSQAWAEYCAEFNWFDEVARKLQDPIKEPWGGGRRRAEVYRESGLNFDSAVKTIRDDGLEPYTIDARDRSMPHESRAAMGPDSEQVRSDEGVERTRRGLELAGSLRAQLTGDWPVRVRLQSAAADWKRRQWIAPAGAIDGVVRDLEPAPTAAMTRAIDASIALDARVRPIATAVEDAEKIAASLAKAEDRVPAAFGSGIGPIVAAALPKDGQGAPANALSALESSLSQVRQTGARIAEVVGRENVDYESLHEAPEYAALVKDLEARADDRTVFDRWVDLAVQFPTLDPALDPRRGWRGDEDLAAIERVVEAVGRPPIPLALDEADASALTRARDEAAVLFGPSRLKWNKRNQQQIVERGAALRSTLTQLRAAADRRSAERAERIRVEREAVVRALEQPVRLGPGFAAIDATAEGWKRALRASVTDENFAQVRDAAQSLDEALSEAIGGLGSTGSESGDGGWESSLAGVVASKVGRQLAAAMAALPTPPEAQQVRAAANQATQAHRAFVDGVQKLTADLKAVEQTLASGFVLAGDAPEVQAASARLRGALDRSVYAEASSEDVRAAVKPLLDRVEAGRAIASETRPEALIRAVESESAATPERAIAAVDRLAALGSAWPSSGEQLQSVAALREPLARAAETIKDQSRRQAVERNIAGALGRMWTNFASAASSPESMDAAIARMADFGVSADRLEPRLRFNVVLSRLRSDLASDALADDKTVPVLQRYSAEIGGISEVAAAPSVSNLRAQLDRIAANQDPPFDPARAGPGLAGWTSRPLDPDNRMLEYSRGQASLSFIRVDGPTQQDNAYLGATEVSLGQFGQIIDAANGDWTIVTSSLEAPRDTVARGWVIEGGRLRPSPDWVGITQGFAILPQGKYGPGVSVEPPSPDQPIQSVSLRAAIYVAALAGCRLPTGEEWRRANQAAANGAGGARIVRGEAFNRQIDYLATAANPDLVPWPDNGIFAYDGSRRVQAKQAVSGNRAGALYFVSVNSGGGAPPYHLVGNIAELIVAGPATFAGTKNMQAFLTGPSKGTIDDAMGELVDLVKGIGGSSLAPSNIPVDREQELDGGSDVPTGWADVGFRLAFTATGRPPLVVQAREQAAKTPYLLATGRP